MFCKNIIKNPYMFRSLLYDRPEGSPSEPSALPFLRLFASSKKKLVLNKVNVTTCTVQK
jgi:hypothetical protein